MVGNSNNSTHVVLKIPSQIGILTKMQTFYILISYNIYRRNFDPIFCLFFFEKSRTPNCLSTTSYQHVLFSSSSGMYGQQPLVPSSLVGQQEQPSASRLVNTLTRYIRPPFLQYTRRKPRNYSVYRKEPDKFQVKQSIDFAQKKIPLICD